MKNNRLFPNTNFVSYECGFVCQTTFELTPKQYLEFILSLIPYLESPLITKIQVASLEIINKKIQLQFDSQQTLVIDTSSFTVKEKTWGGGAFNNCINQSILYLTLNKLGVLSNALPKTVFPLIANKELFDNISSNYNHLQNTLEFQHINGKPRQAVIFTCPSIQGFENPIHDALPKSINIHDRVPHLETTHPNYRYPSTGFYPINNHSPNETFSELESIPQQAEIEFRIGSSQIHQLCKVELPKFKKNHPKLSPSDIYIKRTEFPVLWLLKKSNRVCLNLNETQQIIQHEVNDKFLPKILEKKVLIRRFIQDFGIQNAVISDSDKPLSLCSNNAVEKTISINQYELSKEQQNTIIKSFQETQTPMTENETGCGDALVVGLQIARHLVSFLNKNKAENDIAEFGLSVANTKYFWRESNLGEIPTETIGKILSKTRLLQ